MRFNNLKIALVHDWLTGMRGGEKVLEILCELFPDATLFTLVHKKNSVSSTIENMKIVTSFLQHLPKSQHKYQYYLPIMPIAIERLNVKPYDIIISSSHAVAKGVIKSSDSIHICYCHTPMRYIWDQYDNYFGRGRASFVVRNAMKLVRKYLQNWDVKSSARVDKFIANSKNVQSRIKKIYQKDSYVIYPPVDTKKFKISKNLGDYFLIVSALVPYKRIDIAIEAFNELKEKLIIVGTGNEMEKLKRIARENIEFHGWVKDSLLSKYYENCRALIFPGEEDFGIVPLEAMASGKPVIAYAKGGALETVLEDITGVFFREQTKESLIDAVLKINTKKFNAEDIRKHIMKFDREIFKQKLNIYIDRIISSMLK